MVRFKIQPCCFIAFLLWQVNLSYMSLCCFVCNMSIIILTFRILWGLNEIPHIKCLVCSCLINSNYSSTMVTTILINWSYEASWQPLHNSPASSLTILPSSVGDLNHFQNKETEEFSDMNLGKGGRRCPYCELILLSCLPNLLLCFEYAVLICLQSRFSLSSPD